MKRRTTALFCSVVVLMLNALPLISFACTWTTCPVTRCSQVYHTAPLQRRRPSSETNCLSTRCARVDLPVGISPGLEAGGPAEPLVVTGDAAVRQKRGPEFR